MKKPGGPPGRAQVGLDDPPDAGVLNLHRDPPAVFEDRLMDLSERGGRDRRFIEGRKDLVGILTQFVPQALPDGCEIVRGNGILKPGQRPGVFVRQEIHAGAQELSQFDQDTLKIDRRSAKPVGLPLMQSGATAPEKWLAVKVRTAVMDAIRYGGVQHQEKNPDDSKAQPGTG